MVALLLVALVSPIPATAGAIHVLLEHHDLHGHHEDLEAALHGHSHPTGTPAHDHDLSTATPAVRTAREFMAPPHAFDASPGAAPIVTLTAAPLVSVRPVARASPHLALTSVLRI